MTMMVFWLCLWWLVIFQNPVVRSQTVENRRNRRPVEEGTVRLVGGRTQFEGNVEINHLGHWGSICDDEWDLEDGDVVCRQLGFVLGAAVATTDSRYGKSRRLIWMDNVRCQGNERSLAQCPFDGWRQHDCSGTEAAGVICRTRREQQRTLARINNHKPPPTNPKPKLLSEYFGQQEIPVRLTPEGFVELQIGNQWQNLCFDGFGSAEAQTLCRQLDDQGEAQIFSSIGGRAPILAGIKCKGAEMSLGECQMIEDDDHQCPDKRIAGVRCSVDLPDLVPDAEEVEHTAFLEDRSIMFLQCAMEENCLSRSAYEIDKSDPAWIYETRRLLRFTARIKNQGRADFRPFRDKSLWQWHACHRHYHSMEVFATFDVLDPITGMAVAQGHKASFCLEDNECDPGYGQERYACADYGDQGISVNCVDIYKYDIDCQWIDITDIEPGFYHLKIIINPEMKVPELTFANNAVRCEFFYHDPVSAIISNCTVTRP